MSNRSTALAHMTLVLAVIAACGSSTDPARDAATLDGEARDAAGSRDGAAGDAAAIDGAAPDGAIGPSGCEAAGGTCGCAGGCGPGFHPAPAPLLDMCPQPCDTCGACSQQCCLPDEEADAGGPGPCGGATCTAGQRCIRPCCGGAEPPCEPAPDDAGGCPAGSTTCFLPSGGEGCQTFCTPPPPYCSDTIPTGCMLDASGEVLCLCA
ncbi:MAG: hypothetical protein IT379_29255 [Deltaproteobacteria bacterium]|nr:hypothetical protein [Deltaproteobacteria bacterium]